MLTSISVKRNTGNNKTEETGSVTPTLGMNFSQAMLQPQSRLLATSHQLRFV